MRATCARARAVHAGPRAQAAQTLLGATEQQLATWTLYSFSYVALDLQAGVPFGVFYTELESRAQNNAYNMSWDGVMLNGESECNAGAPSSCSGA